MREAPPVELSGIRVLVASRDAVYSRFLTERLTREGMTVVTAAATSLGTFAGLDPSQLDVVLVETYGLDDAEWSMVELVRESAPLIEVLALSSEPLVAPSVDALREGVFSILTYPVTDDQLVSEISRACARKRRGEARLRETEGRNA